ncbi:MAG TPA: PaaI family thioesterase [Bacillota bacterium]
MSSPFWQLLGLTVAAAEPGRAVLQLTVNDQLKQVLGTVHGGVTAALIDSAVIAALQPLLEPGVPATTVEMNVNYLAPARAGTLRAEARILKCGRTLALGAVEVRDDEQTLIAHGTATYMILRPAQAPAATT